MIRFVFKYLRDVVEPKLSARLSAKISTHTVETRSDDGPRLLSALWILCAMVAMTLGALEVDRTAVKIQKRRVYNVFNVERQKPVKLVLGEREKWERQQWCTDFWESHSRPVFCWGKSTIAQTIRVFYARSNRRTVNDRLSWALLLCHAYGSRSIELCLFWELSLSKSIWLLASIMSYNVLLIR